MVGVGVPQGSTGKEKVKVEMLAVGAQEGGFDLSFIALATTLAKWRFYSSALREAFFTEIAAILGGRLTVVARGWVKVVE